MDNFHLALDVLYENNLARIGFVLFESIHSKTPYRKGNTIYEKVEPYISGEFYKRELPCLLFAISQIPEKINLIFVDGNVWLQETKKGLGYYLYESLDQKIPVVGVAKTFYEGSQDVAIPILRGKSKKPLYISSVGIDKQVASEMVKNMFGENRIPQLLQIADSESRNIN